MFVLLKKNLTWSDLWIVGNHLDSTISEPRPYDDNFILQNR